MEDYAIKFEHVSKIYKLKKKDGNTKNAESFYALKDISLRFRGSKNQRIIDLNRSRSEKRMVLWDGEAEG